MFDPDEINHHFVNITSDFQKFGTAVFPEKPNQITTPPATLIIKEISIQQLNEAWKSIKNQTKTFPDPLGIPNKLVSILIRQTLYVNNLLNLINNSIKQKYFPGVLKLAKVVPLPKCGNPETLNELRPISIAPVFSKILEKIVYE